jgi:hypothetical protein
VAVAGVVEPMDVHAQALITSTSPTPTTATLAAEWEKLSTMRGVVLQMRESDGHGGRGGNDNRLLTNSTAQRTASVVSANGSTFNKSASTNDNSVVSEVTDRGLQNGRTFGRGANGAN